VECGGFPSLDIGTSKKISSTIKDLRPISKEDAELWVRYWIDVKYI